MMPVTVPPMAPSRMSVAVHVVTAPGVIVIGVGSKGPQSSVINDVPVSPNW